MWVRKLLSSNRKWFSKISEICLIYVYQLVGHYLQLSTYSFLKAFRRISGVIMMIHGHLLVASRSICSHVLQKQLVELGWTD